MGDWQPYIYWFFYRLQESSSNLFFSYPPYVVINSPENIVVVNWQPCSSSIYCKRDAFVYDRKLNPLSAFTYSIPRLSLLLVFSLKIKFTRYFFFSVCQAFSIILWNWRAMKAKILFRRSLFIQAPSNFNQIPIRYFSSKLAISLHVFIIE